jgi:hypothetical protein
MNPNARDAMIALGLNPEVVDLRARLWELQCRVDDLAAYVHAHVQTEPVTDDPPPVADVLAVTFGTCDHGRLLRDHCPDCSAGA